MPARDLYHDTVKNALVRDGWTITHDPYRLPVGMRDSFVDLGAQKLLAAEKDTRLPEATMEGIFADKIADVLFGEKLVVALTFDPAEEVIVRWIP